MAGPPDSADRDDIIPVARTFIVMKWNYASVQLCLASFQIKAFLFSTQLLASMLRIRGLNSKQFVLSLPFPQPVMKKHFLAITDAWARTEAWRRDHNESRPHAGWNMTVEYAIAVATRASE